MRKFIIEDEIVFTPIDCTITSLNSGETITIPLISCKLLEMLISFRGQVVLRDDIFAEVFDRYNASSTNNNLNQYVRLLRKNFEVMGVNKDVIITVPRLGFMVNADLVVRTEHEKNHSELGLNSKDTLSSSLTFIYKNELFIISILILIMVTIYFSYQYLYIISGKIKWVNIPVVKVLKVEHVNGCDVNVLPSSMTVAYSNYTRVIENITQSGEMQCVQADKTRYYIHNSIVNPQKKRSFILKCVGDKEKTPYCFSEYVSTEVP